MHPVFRSLTDQLHNKFVALMNMPPLIAERVSADTPVGGVYLFMENDVALYAGRTKRRIGLRIRNHFGSAPDCPFAWLLARAATGHRPTYRTVGSRRDLLNSPEFLQIYGEAKRRIKTMHVRYVHEPDPLRQTLLEVYTAVVARAKYNDFDTH